jgi:hypothetical protein
VSLTYLYCLLPGDAQVNVEGLAGIEEDKPVEIIPAGALQAAASDVGEDFSEENLNTRITDLDWLSPRAVRHHEVVDQLFERCRPLLPLSFGTIFRSKESLRQRIASQEKDLLARLEKLRGREEWDLKMSREEAVFSAELRRHSPALRRTEKELASKPPGTRFLLEKKLHHAEAREARRVSASVRKDVHDALSAHAVETHRDQLAAPPQPQSVRLELRSAYLVGEATAGSLQETARRMARKYASLGYELELTGPWPPFTFAGGVREVLA